MLPGWTGTNVHNEFNILAICPNIELVKDIYKTIQDNAILKPPCKFGGHIGKLIELSC